MLHYLMPGLPVDRSFDFYKHEQFFNPLFALYCGEWAGSLVLMMIGSACGKVGNCLFSIRLSQFYMSVCLSLTLFLSVFLTLSLSVCLSTCLSLTLYLSVFCLLFFTPPPPPPQPSHSLTPR